MVGKIWRGLRSVSQIWPSQISIEKLFFFLLHSTEYSLRVQRLLIDSHLKLNLSGDSINCSKLKDFEALTATQYDFFLLYSVAAPQPNKWLTNLSHFLRQTSDLEISIKDIELYFSLSHGSHAVVQAKGPSFRELDSIELSKAYFLAKFKNGNRECDNGIGIATLFLSRDFSRRKKLFGKWQLRNPYSLSLLVASIKEMIEWYLSTFKAPSVVVYFILQEFRLAFFLRKYFLSATYIDSIYIDDAVMGWNPKSTVCQALGGRKGALIIDCSDFPMIHYCGVEAC